MAIAIGLIINPAVADSVMALLNLLIIVGPCRYMYNLKTFYNVCRYKLHNIVSNFTAASRGFPCGSTAFLYQNAL